MLRPKGHKISLILSVIVHLTLLIPLQFILTASEKRNYSATQGQSSLLNQIKLHSVKIEKQVLPSKKMPNPALKKTVRPKKKLISKSTNGQKNAGQKDHMSKYLTHVREKISQYKFKNRLATKLRLKGKVKVKFDLTWPNRIHNIELLSPSKYSASNTSALESLKRVEELPHFPKEIDTKTIPVTLSMVFE